MNEEQQVEKMSHIYARSCSDEGFRRSLLANPATVLKAGGMSLPDNIEIVAAEDSDTMLNLVIPARQAEGELSDAQLADMSGGFLSLAFLIARGIRTKLK